jgi:hypothetical protein
VKQVAHLVLETWNTPDGTFGPGNMDYPSAHCFYVEAHAGWAQKVKLARHVASPAQSACAHCAQSNPGRPGTGAVLRSWPCTYYSLAGLVLDGDAWLALRQTCGLSSGSGRLAAPRAVGLPVPTSSLSFIVHQHTNAVQPLRAQLARP